MTLGAGTIAVLFGPPGSGKGTQARHIADTLGVALVATGDLLRAEVATGTALGREVGPIMSTGALVPDELMVRVVESRLDLHAAHGALLDGFPRTVHQARALDAMLARTGRRLDFLIALDVPNEELRERILSRAAAEGRADDTPETVQTRLEVYARETAPVLAHYEQAGVVVRSVDGLGSVDEVRARVTAALVSLTPGKVAS